MSSCLRAVGITCSLKMSSTLTVSECRMPQTNTGKYYSTGVVWSRRVVLQSTFS